MTNTRPKPVVLCVLDGWGIAPPYDGNAVSLSKTPYFDSLLSHYPVTALTASGEGVGLPFGEMGNSEVGHLNLGAGRIIYQNLPRINKAISDNSFFDNQALTGAIEHIKKNKSDLHLMGLLTNGGIHASVDHLISLIALASKNKVKNLYLHLFLDGRDMAKDSALTLIKDIERTIKEYKTGTIATLSGRFYAMDRDNHWDRIEKSFLAIAEGKSDNKFSTPKEAIESSYTSKVYDEEFIPAVITKNNKPIAVIKDKDAVVFFNFRADRAREMTKAFVVPSFNKFNRSNNYTNLYFVTMTQYEKNLPIEIAFPPEKIENTLGQVLSAKNLKQLRIAETEKYAHVTYFFNGGNEETYENEERVVVPSPSVESYAQQPKMSAPEILTHLKKEINKDTHDFILVNFANPDMVGHTGDLDATISALEYLDKAIKELAELVLSKDGVIIFTADHGNCEKMFNMQTGKIDKEHTTNPVPLIIVGKDFEGKKIDQTDVSSADLSILKTQGILSDIAPTILKIMGVEQPGEMTGRSLI